MINNDDMLVIKRVLKKSILSSHDGIDELNKELIAYKNICDEIEKNKKSIFGDDLQKYIEEK